MKTIPRRFSLFGQDIVVKRIHDLHVKNDEYGKWSPNTNEILIQESAKSYSEDVLLQTFWHEAVHACLDTLGYSKESEDEKFVEQMGQAIYQILKTMR